MSVRDMPQDFEEPPTPYKYQCDFECGNDSEFVIVTLSDNTAQKLCMPCFVGVATDIVMAMAEPDNPNVVAAVEEYAAREADPVGTRGRNAIRGDDPNATPDFSMFEAFEPDVADADD